MTTYKCRKCGAPLMPQEDQITAVCQNCGNLLRLPRVDKDLYNRANELRMEKRFDQAAAMFRECISQDPQDAELHWNLLLCKFGVEYVKDEDGSLIPTCNGITYDPILEDEDYQDAVRFADEISARLYQNEAQRLQVIQQEIIKLSQKSEEFDVFISYKETDAEGGRTEDSVMAHTIYEELTKKGYKVFFSRVTLKGQAGLKYEPIIFSALNSAPVMLLIGTSKENLESVWVKNEWTRFLHLMEEDKDKKIEVVYKGIDRIDLPARLRFVPQRKISANDKFGWHQDVAYDVDSMLEFRKKDMIPEGGFIRETDEEAKERAVQNVYLRTEQILETGDLDEAKECLKQALDIDVERAETWWKLLNLETDDLTYFHTSTPKPSNTVQEYAKGTIAYAKDSEADWKKAAQDYLLTWQYGYANVHHKELQRSLHASERYSKECKEKIYREYEIVKQYAATSVKEEAEKELQAWEAKFPLLDEYYEKTQNTYDVFQMLKNNDAEYANMADSLCKHRKKLNGIEKVPLVFGFWSPLFMLYLAIAPFTMKFWELKDPSGMTPLRSWFANGSIVCFLLYLVVLAFGMLLAIIDRTNRYKAKKENDMEWANWSIYMSACISVLVGFIAPFARNALLKLATKFIDIEPAKEIVFAMEVNNLDVSRANMNAIVLALQPYYEKFTKLLIVLAVVHFVLAILTRMQVARLNAARAKEANLRTRLEEHTISVFAEFKKPYVDELGVINDRMQSDLKNAVSDFCKYDKRR